jgi:hypothetical protein
MRKNLLIAIAAVSVLFNACTYEEGPMSLASKKARLANSWNQTILDGGFAPPSNMTVTLLLDKDGTGKQTVATKNQQTGNVSEAILDVKWKWGSSKEELILERSWSGVSQGEKKYRIVRLASNEMKLENEGKIIETFVTKE